MSSQKFRPFFRLSAIPSLLVLAIGVLSAMATRVSAAIITVDTLADDNNSLGLVTLRQAITAANTDTSVNGSVAGSGADTIEFLPSLFAGGPGTISLTFGPGYTQNMTGASLTDWFGPTAFRVTTPITIEGPTGSNGLTVKALQNGATSVATSQRIFTVASTGNLELDNLTLSGGTAIGGAGTHGLLGSANGFASGGGLGAGGAIFSDGTLTLNSDTLTSNSATGGVGATKGTGTNAVGAGGGGMGATSTVTATGGGPNGGVPRTAAGIGNGGTGGGGGGGASSAKPGGNGGFGGGGGSGGSGANNQTGGSGGFGGGGGSGGSTSGDTLSGGSAFAGGVAKNAYSGSGAGLGGAIFNLGGTLNITNTTFTANSAIGGAGEGAGGAGAGSGLGGAIFNADGTLNITNSTLSGNAAAQGGTDLYAYSGLITLDAKNGINLASTSATVKLLNDILGQNSNTFTDYNSTGAVTTTGSFTNLIRNNSGAGPFPSGAVFSNGDPLLPSALADNGGPTETLLPGAGSPAIGNGTLADAPADDQTGATRGPSIDIGAVQVPAEEGPAVPEPSTWALLASGLAGLGLLGRQSVRRQRFCQSNSAGPADTIRNRQS